MKLIGGRARLSGISFYTDSGVTAAIVDDNGNISIQQTSLKANRHLNKLRRIPFIRGIVALLTMMFDNKWFLIIFLACLIPWDYLFPSQVNQINFANWSVPDWVFYVFIVLFIFIMRFGFRELWRFHGAEHKAVNAYSKNKELNFEEVKKESRVALNCGTNLMIFIYFITLILAWPLENHEILLFLTSISIGYELFKLDPHKPFVRPFYLIGGLVQKYLVTSEPKNEEIEMAIAALKRAMADPQSM